MGYCTSYDLKWSSSGQPDYTDEIRKRLGDLADQVEIVVKDVSDAIGDYIENDENMSYALDREGDGQESCKWYEHEADLRKMSAKFPTVLFTLKGEGEESGDIWIKYFLNGKMQKCKAQLSFEAYDPNKLT